MSMQDNYAKYSEKEWEDILAESFLGNVPNGLALPGFPPQNLVKHTNGRYHQSVMDQAARFHRLVKDLLREKDADLTRDTKILDFGCGWGRILRYFLREVSADNLYGTDQSRHAINFCNEAMTAFGRFSLNSERPPLDFEADTFDLVFAQSVFSHFSPESADAWAKELGRVLKPQGLFFLTTLKQDDLVEPANPNRQDINSYRKHLHTTFNQQSDLIENYLNGGIAFIQDAGSNPNWGHAAVSEAYIRDNWGQYGLELVKWMDTGYPQTVALLRASEP